MFAIEEGMKKINDVVVETFARTASGRGTVLEVEAGTNGFKGTPCRKAGSRTYLRIECWEGDFHFGTITDDEGTPVGVEIACCGDAGLNAVMKALAFAQDAISDQCCEVDD